MENIVHKKTISPREMGKMLGLKKTGTYWLMKKGYFETVVVDGNLRIVTESFENWLASQSHYKKILTKEEEDQKFLDEVINKINDERSPKSIVEKKSYTVAEIQEKLCVSRTSVYNLLKQGVFPVEYIDRYIRIPKQSFDDWMKREY